MGSGGDGDRMSVTESVPYDNFRGKEIFQSWVKRQSVSVSEKNRQLQTRHRHNNDYQIGLAATDLGSASSSSRSMATPGSATCCSAASARGDPLYAMSLLAVCKDARRDAKPRNILAPVDFSS